MVLHVLCEERLKDQSLCPVRKCSYICMYVRMYMCICAIKPFCMHSTVPCLHHVNHIKVCMYVRMYISTQNIYTNTVEPHN